jgi:hypothetical protein
MEQPRNGDLNQPGHPGQWASKNQTAATIALPPPAGAPDFDDDWDDFPPTKREVDEAEELMNALRPSRPMYRGDWERVNGGYGVTAGQHNAYQASRNNESDRYRAAVAEYERMRAAWEASDKRQDIGSTDVRCDHCGEWFDEYDGRCPHCGN